VIIGRLIPAGTGFNAYEELSISPTTDDLSLDTGSVFEDGDDPLDVVLDDRTARAYSLEGGLGEGFTFERAPIVEEDDGLMISDEVLDLDEDDDDFEDDDDDDDDDE
jgi:DNA-directed RNA polymerase subunit beta'